MVSLYGEWNGWLGVGIKYQWLLEAEQKKQTGVAFVSAPFKLLLIPFGIVVN